MNTTERNKAAILQMLEEVARNGITSQVDYFSDDAMNHGIPVGRDGVREVLEDIASTFPDVHFELADVVAEGDWVVVRCYMVGTHLGTGRHPFVHEGLLAGVEPTGSEMRVQHIHMFRMKDGRIAEHWACRDDVDMVRQLGVTNTIGAIGA